MEMTRTKMIGMVSAIWFAALRGISMIRMPLALAASSGSDYKIDLMRANTIYKNPDPKPSVQVALGLFRRPMT